MKDPVTLAVYQCTFFCYTQNKKNQEKKGFFNVQPGHQGAQKGVTQPEIGVTLISFLKKSCTSKFFFHKMKHYDQTNRGNIAIPINFFPLNSKNGQNR